MWGPYSGPHIFPLRLRFRHSLCLAGLAISLLAGCSTGTHQHEKENPGIADEFFLLRGAPEAMSIPLRAHLAQVLYPRNRHLRLNAQLVQSQDTRNGTAWVFLQGHHLCLAYGVPESVACSAVDKARREGVSLGSFTPPSPGLPQPHDFVLMGVVPDSVQQVIVSTGSRQRNLKVSDNLYAASGNRPILIRRFVRR